MSILIKNGRIIDPANNIDAEMDLFVNDDGLIEQIENNITKEATRVIDAANCWVTPGFIDLHVHLRDPGYEYKETIATGAAAAAAGGFTTICCMPNTNPVTDCVDVVEDINYRAKREALANILPIGSVTKGQEGEELSPISDMAGHGICAVSEDGKTVINSQLMKEALDICAKLNLPMFSHCEDISLTDGGAMNHSQKADELGLKGISNASEEVIVARDIIMSIESNAKLHICHVSTKGSVDLIRHYLNHKPGLTAEACPHHFTLTHDDIDGSDANYKMSPPLRSKNDVKAILDGLKDGTIAVIATDHAPHHKKEKNCDFAHAANGIVGLETALPLSITYLVNTGVLTPLKMIEKLTANPAKVLGVKKGSLSINSVADITVIDPLTQYKIDVNKFRSKSKNSPYDGYEVCGKVKTTIVSGRIVYDNR